MQSSIRKLAFITLAAMVGLAVYAIPNAIAVYGQEKQTVVFLTGATCEKDLKYLSERLPDYWVVCAYHDNGLTPDPSVAWARMHLSEFEKYYHVVYVQNAYYSLTPTYKVAGITFGNYSIAIPADFVIKHELQHQICQCFQTPDHVHG